METMAMAHGLLALAGAAAFAACAAVRAPEPFDPRSLFDDAAFAPVEISPEPAELLALDRGQLAGFRAEFAKRREGVPSKRLAFVAYIHDLYARLEYGDATGRAADVLESGRGNCLGLALLTAALAEELRIPYVFQEVLAPPVWDRRNGMMVVNKHVDVWVFDPAHPGDEYRMALRRVELEQTASIIDFFPMSTTYPAAYLDNDRVIAMFYANRAGEALIAERLDEAYAYAREALEVDPEFAAAWNILGLVYAHRGLPLAERTYLYAQSLEPDELTVVNNLAVWYERSGRPGEAARWRARVDAAAAKNPFQDFDRGELAFAKGDYRTASILYRRAANADPYQGEFQFGLFKAYWMMGRKDRALDALRAAIRITQDGAVAERYNRKLMMLSASATP
jgi:Flp pilus assembly protein TadD